MTQQITKLFNFGGQLNIIHSNYITDKKDCYRVQFDSLYQGCTCFIPKETLQKKEIKKNHLECKLYLPTSQFLADSSYWIDEFKKTHEKHFGEYNWYRELEVVERELR